MDKPLKSCPFCGQLCPGVATTTTEIYRVGHYVVCNWCGCTGAVKGTREEAVNVWNHRAEGAARAALRASLGALRFCRYHQDDPVLPKKSMDEIKVFLGIDPERDLSEELAKYDQLLRSGQVASP